MKTLLMLAAGLLTLAAGLGVALLIPGLGVVLLVAGIAAVDHAWHAFSSWVSPASVALTACTLWMVCVGAVAWRVGRPA